MAQKLSYRNILKTCKNIIGLENVDNNLCFWACLALAEGCRRDRYISKAKELYNSFYRSNPLENYEGFDFINELDEYETFNTKYAINIISYYEDGSVEYIRRSKFNPDRVAIYLNLYLDHFSYIPNFEKLAKKYICSRCSAKFQRNEHLERHMDTCKLEQEDTFVKYPQIL